MKAQNDTLFYV